MEEQEWRLQDSPIREHESFVIYDESHCRGADMKFNSSTFCLGPRMCKDKMMQAACRLRRLVEGQSLDFASTKEIDRDIRQCNHLAELDLVDPSLIFVQD
jgi:hypothetical protein